MTNDAAHPPLPRSVEDRTSHKDALLRDRASRVAFRPEVPEVVVWRFGVVRDLLLHGDRSFSFADVAFERSLLTLETAFRLKHRELHGTDPTSGSPNLQKLYRWAVQSDLVDMDAELIEALRRVRNRIAHPTANTSYGGPGGAIRATLRIVDVINDVFEPPETRRARRTETERLSGWLNTLNAIGADLVVGTEHTRLWRTELLYVENRLEEAEVGIAVWPRFEIPTPTAKTTDMGEPRTILCTAAREVDGGLAFDRAGPEPVMLQALQNADAVEHADWWRDVEQVAGLVGGYVFGELRRTTRDDVSRRVRARWAAARAESNRATQ